MSAKGPRDVPRRHHLGEWESGLQDFHRLHTTRRLVLAAFVLTGQPAWAGRDCDAPPETWQPRTAVSALAERNGWQVDRLKVDDGCYEIKGRDAEGQRLKVKIDPASLKIISVKRQDREHDREHRRLAPP